jgi:hypothetical protein
MKTSAGDATPVSWPVNRRIILPKDLAGYR